MSKRGFSLIELIVVVAILAIVLAIGIPLLSKYIKKYNIEKETNQIYSDLVSQRFKSISTGGDYGIVFNPNSYTLFRFNDIDYNMQFDETKEMADAATKNVKYRILKKKTDGSFVPAADNVVIFDKSGFVRNVNWGIGGFTIKVDSVGVGSMKYNCVIISTQRIKESMCQ